MSRRRSPRAYPSATAASLMLAPAVVAARLPRLIKEAGDSQRTPREATRAVTEKMVATAEGVAAANLAMAGAMFSFWPDLLAGKVPALVSGAALRDVADAALKPAGKRVRANLRRLTRNV